ncbi:CBS domain-containing protein CBSX3, mitochondrial isoform X1 [Primulina tabacum]|uniref:CBS domain-containing protein CBSX3, mitochondrial isoform X1 n=1 Tax=Primulina tabacum TaxID=48773 RepID=UPI003F5A511E
MQRLIRAVRSCCESTKILKTENLHIGNTPELINVLSQRGLISSSQLSPKKKNDKCFNGVMLAKSHTIPEKGLQNTTVAEVLMTKGEGKVESWLWCRTDDTVYDAVKHMAKNNVGSLVVMKPGEQQTIAGILTERDYLLKMIVQDRSSKHTQVKDIMTNQDKLISVTSDTGILNAMQVMTGKFLVRKKKHTHMNWSRHTLHSRSVIKSGMFVFIENHIRHIPVIDGKLVGMISIVDVVRAVVEQQGGEVRRLNEFIRGEYY